MNGASSAILGCALVVSLAFLMAPPLRYNAHRLLHVIILGAVGPVITLGPRALCEMLPVLLGLASYPYM